MGPTPDSVQLATHDTWNEETRISRMLVMAFNQVPAILQGLLDAEASIVNMEATDQESWPELPIVLAEAEGEKSTVKVLVDVYKGRLEVKLTKSNGGNRSRQWIKWNPNSNRDMMRVILHAYDAIEATSDIRVPAEKSPADDDLL